LKEVLARVGAEEILKVGGSGYKAILVATGMADAYLYPETVAKKWDICAPDAIVRAAGGVVESFAGGEDSYDFNSGNIATNGVRCM
jgi:3'(2'), 5'-bisphosphate nucleotidase